MKTRQAIIASAKRMGITFQVVTPPKAHFVNKRLDRFVKRARRLQDFTPRLVQNMRPRLVKKPA